MCKCEHSNELVNLVKKFLTDDDWNFLFNENTGVFDFDLKIRSKIQKINYIIDVREDEIIIYGICPIGAENTDTNMMAQMAEFVCRVNYGLKNGCFEFNFHNGEIRFKSFIDCDNVMPSIEVIENSIYCIADMYQYYAPGIVDIIFSDRIAKEAIEKCKKIAGDERRSMMTKAVSEAMKDDNIKEMIARLTTRFGVTEDSENKSDEGTDISSDEIRVNPLNGTQEGGKAE